MKNIFPCLLLVLAACKSPAQTLSPNRLSGTEATVLLTDGASVSGKVSLNNEVLVERNIEVVAANGEKHLLHLLDVKGYEKDGVYYELKHTGNHLHPRSGFYFMKRLTPEGSPFQLFEHLERKQKGKSMVDVAYEPVYYLQLPGEQNHRVYPSFSRRLTPHFHKKMSALVADCPELADKVHDKTPGYFYSRMDATEEKRKAILLRIIDNYNACSKKPQNNKPAKFSRG